ncbi:DMT family transporter [Nocardia amikacinitolerans]|uniref:DMT family transporter n=1 Tax=Nocardia amikacinitolerans TaxID=756689 RepID=UPI0020A3818B|nr:DMT family transporter [Nocardia amikacinitolerans]MCP2291235.1 putative blue pigment (indigoidine) exporter [Nocardia amikacinitolerans]
MSITIAARNPYAGTLALTALTPIVWGSTYAVTTEFLPPDRPLFTALMRALPAGLVLLALTRTLPRGMWVGRAAALGVLNIGAFFPLLFLAAYRLPGGVAGVLGAVAPMFALVFATGVLNERPTGRKVLAGVIGVFGVALVVLRATAQLDTIGVIAGLVGAASMALGTVLTKRWGRPEGVGPLAMTGWQLTAGGLFILPLAALIEGAPPAMDGRAVGGYLYLGVIGTAAAYWLWLRGIAKVPATSVAFLGLLSPVSAAVIGWVALGQALTGLQILGMVIALGGTLLGQTTARVRAAKVSGPAAGSPTAELGGAVPDGRGVAEVGQTAEVGADGVGGAVELGAADQPVEVGAADQPGLAVGVGGETVGDVVIEDAEKDGRTTGDSRILVGAKS